MNICSDLENIADWLREKDENISPKNRKRLDKLAKKIERCSSELEAIVQSVCKYLEDKHIATFNFDNDSCVYQSASAAL